MKSFIDWLTSDSVRDNAAVTLFLGGVLAIYTGLIASRIFAFFQARYKCLLWFVSIHDFIKQRFSSPHDFYASLTMHCYPVIAEMKALGHDRASRKIADVWQAFVANGALAFGLQYQWGQVPPFPTNEQPLLMLHLFKANREMMEHRREHFVHVLSTLAPNWWPIFTPLPFPNYMTFRGQAIGLLIPRKSALEVMWLELKRRSNKPVRDMLEFAGRRSDCGDCCKNCNRTI